MPESGKLLLEAVEHVGVGDGIAARQRHLWQVAGFQQIGGLLAQVDGILQQAQFGTEGLCLFHFGFRCQADDGNVLGILVGQRHLLVDRQSDGLAEEHLRQHHAVVDARQRHLGLVHLHVDGQTVATCGHALVNHLVDVVVELLHQVEIGLGQSLLMFQRADLPVGLLRLVECALLADVGGVLLHLLVDVGHVVQRYEGTTHEDGLRQEDGASPDVAGVGAEGVDNLLSLLVQPRAQLLHTLSHLLLQFAGHLLERLCRQPHLSEHRADSAEFLAQHRHTGLEGADGCGAEITQRHLLSVVED